MSNISLKRVVKDTERYILDINEILEYSEIIFSKYITLPNDLIYVKGIRYNILNRCDLHNIPKKYITNKPELPVISVEYMMYMLSSYILNLSELVSDFKVNKLMPSDAHSTNFISELNIIEDTSNLIYSYIPDISDDDTAKLNEILEKLYRVVDKHLTNFNKIHKIEYEHNMIILILFEDIRVYRYEEYLIYRECNHVKEV